jgi:hypothetical protein
VAAVGLEAASIAEVYGDLVDLAVVIELAMTDTSMSEAVLTLICEFQVDCIEIVVDAYLRAGRDGLGSAS